MPHLLINKINKLVNLRFPSQRKPGGDPFLSSFRNDLPEEVLDAIDDINDEARKVFGPQLKPDVRQENILANAGFKVSKGRSENGIWYTGHIETPKGIIVYR